MPNLWKSCSLCVLGRGAMPCIGCPGGPVWRLLLLSVFLQRSISFDKQFNSSIFSTGETFQWCEMADSNLIIITWHQSSLAKSLVPGHKFPKTDFTTEMGKFKEFSSPNVTEPEHHAVLMSLCVEQRDGAAVRVELLEIHQSVLGEDRLTPNTADVVLATCYQHVRYRTAETSREAETFISINRNTENSLSKSASFVLKGIPWFYLSFTISFCPQESISVYRYCIFKHWIWFFFLLLLASISRTQMYFLEDFF